MDEHTNYDRTRTSTMDRDAHASPANTKEFVALWNTAKEEHFVSQLAPVLPRLFGGSVPMDPERAEWAARHLVRALYMAEMPEAGAPAAVEYLVEVIPRDSRAGSSDAREST